MNGPVIIPLEERFVNTDDHVCLRIASRFGGGFEQFSVAWLSNSMQNPFPLIALVVLTLCSGVFDAQGLIYASQDWQDGNIQHIEP